MPDNVAGESEKVATDHLNKLKLIRQKQISAGYRYAVLSDAKKHIQYIHFHIGMHKEKCEQAV